MADDRAKLGVDAPVDKQAETLIAEPFQPTSLVKVWIVFRQYGHGRQKAGQ